MRKWDRFTHTPRVAILLTACALLYAHMRRRQPSYLLPQVAIESGYTWAAAALLGTAAWYALQPAAIAVAWCMLGTILVETGLATQRNFFRRQGFVLLTIGFVRLFFANIDLAAAPRLYTVLPLAALFAFVYQRLHEHPQTDRRDRIAGVAAAWFSLSAVTALLYFSVRPAWVCVGGAMLVITTMLLARVLRRPLFTAHIDLRHCAERAQTEARLRQLGAAANLLFLPVDLFTIGYSKDQELEADRDGTTLAVQSGYSYTGILALFQRFAQLEPEHPAPPHSNPLAEAVHLSIYTLSDYFASHPPVGQRAEQVELLAQQQRWPARTLQPISAAQRTSYDLSASGRTASENGQHCRLMLNDGRSLDLGLIQATWLLVNLDCRKTQMDTPLFTLRTHTSQGRQVSLALDGPDLSSNALFKLRGEINRDPTTGWCVLL